MPSTCATIGGSGRVPLFADFFRGVMGSEPYRWQVEAADAIASGDPPEAISVPTGMGKTSLMLCWLWALARDLERCEANPEVVRRVPLRYIVVVDRRVVVNHTVGDARQLADLLSKDDGKGSVGVAAVADVVRRFVGDDDQVVLQVRELRGGMQDKPENVRHPAAPAIIVGTVDLVGSRLLWRGYGVSWQRRPIEAALIGVDCLFVLDEAHIAAQFLQSLRTVDAGHESRLEGSIPGRHVIEVTATPGTKTAPFDWDAEVAAAPEIAERRRRRRAVPVRVVQTGTRTADAGVPEVVKSLGLSAGQSYLVFANTPGTAKKAATAAAKLSAVSSGECESLVLVGGMPEFFHDQPGENLRSVQKRLGRFRTGAVNRGLGPGLVVCATQTLEVGADIDGDHLITPVTTAAALKQRLGRVNRVGARDGGSICIVVAAGSDTKGEPVYGHPAVALGRALINEQPSTLGALEDLLDRPESASEWERTVRVPAVLPRHVFDAYVRTGGSPHEPPVGRWLRYPDDPRAEIVVAFRAAVDDIDDEYALVQHIQRWPPMPAESWTVPIGLGEELLKAAGKQGSRAALLDPSRSELLNSSPTKEDLRPGWILVLGPQEDAFGVPGAGADLIRGLAPEQRPFALVHVAESIGSPEDGEADALRGSLAARAGEGDLDAAARYVEQGIDGENGLAPVFTVTAITTQDGTPTGWMEISRSRGWMEPIPEALVSLSEHQSAVADRARVWAEMLRLPEHLVDDIALAAAHHDDGKLEDIVQQELRYTLDAEGNLRMLPSLDGDAVAKSTLPRRWWGPVRRLVGMPPGYRHEAASAARLDHNLHTGEVHAHDPQLVTHLVVTHHGLFRGPGLAITDVRVPIPAYQDAGTRQWAERSDEFAQLVERYGPYTLAMAEAIVRLADWRESRTTPPQVVDKGP